MNRFELGPGTKPREKTNKEISAALGVLIVGVRGDDRNNPLIWTIKELDCNDKVKKVAGQISVPVETRKVGEDRFHNLLGALSEFCSDNDLVYVRRHLFVVDGLFEERVVNINGNFADISLLIYDGSLDFPLTPLDKQEVCPNGWIGRNDIFRMDNLRPGVRQALQLERAHALIGKAMEAYYRNPESLKPAFPINFKSMEEFNRRREELSDLN